MLFGSSCKARSTTLGHGKAGRRGRKSTAGGGKGLVLLTAYWLCLIPKLYVVRLSMPFNSQNCPIGITVWLDFVIQPIYFLSQVQVPCMAQPGTGGSSTDWSLENLESSLVCSSLDQMWTAIWWLSIMLVLESKTHGFNSFFLLFLWKKASVSLLFCNILPFQGSFASSRSNPSAMGFSVLLPVFQRSAQVHLFDLSQFFKCFKTDCFRTSRPDKADKISRDHHKWPSEWLFLHLFSPPLRLSHSPWQLWPSQRLLRPSSLTASCSACHPSGPPSSLVQAHHHPAETSAEHATVPSFRCKKKNFDRPSNR